MTARTLVRIDRLLWPVNRLLTLIERAFHKNLSYKENHVVVLKFLGIGSIVRWAALCEEKSIDKSQLVLVTFDRHRELVALLGFDNCIFIRTQSITTFMIDCFNVIRSARRSKPSFIVDFERCSNSVSILRRLMCPAGTGTISFEEKENKKYVTRVVYSAERLTLDQLFAVGSAVMARRPRGESPGRSVSVNSTKVLININASDYLLARRYPRDYFATFIRQLAKTYSNLEFVFTGSRNEIEYVQALIHMLGPVNARNTAGQWNFRQLFNELSDCKLFITGDSGPLHIAAYLGIPTVAIWGPTQPGHFGYLRHPSLRHVNRPMACAPCLKHPGSTPARLCKGKIPCMTELSPQNIIDAVEELMLQETTVRTVHLSVGAPKTQLAYTH